MRKSFAVIRAWWDGAVETHVNSEIRLTKSFRAGGGPLLEAGRQPDAPPCRCR
jgi:hypothetical protein